MKSLIENIKDKDAVNASTRIESLLKLKTRTAINEAKKEVATNLYSKEEDNDFCNHCGEEKKWDSYKEKGICRNKMCPQSPEHDIERD
jgi:aspartate carbamoyltransferase regulatory subunit